MSNLQGKTALVTGGSRGFGRGIVEALAAKGMRVVAVARDKDRLAALERELAGQVATIAADITDTVAVSRIMQEQRPDVLALNAGAAPLLRPIQDHTWESFSVNWETDVKAAFLWTREAMHLPLAAGSTVIIVSSGAAIAGSPLSGGYSGAKRTQWLMAGFLQQESEANNLGIRFHALLPTLTAETDLGRIAAVAYAKRGGVTMEQFLERMGPPLTPAIVGQGVLDILSNPEHSNTLAFQINGHGLEPIAN